ncbi:MAG TPA: hypothetical protein PKA61_04270 [Nitrospira sp.]|nr:hypothetical protein [Nitrospira sp.]
MNPSKICAAILVAIMSQAAVLYEPAEAIQAETQAEKEANLKGQITGGLFNRWTFDQQHPSESPADFSQLTSGGESTGAWTIESDAGAPSPPNMLKAVSSCKQETCYRILVASKLQYEYPDVSVRLRFPAEGGAGRGGIVIGLKDTSQFYAAIVDLSSKLLEVIRVVDGKVTVLGQTAIAPKAVDWHSLRIQRNTIISKDFIETFFDGSQVLSIQDHSLGFGEVGLVVLGNSSLYFDSLHAIPLFSQRPLSAPAAY